MAQDYSDTIKSVFPKSVPAGAFVETTFEQLGRVGFSAENTLAGVVRCRDELTQPLTLAIQETWGEAFDFSCLGGLYSAGKTGIGAFIAHAPSEHDRKRVIFFVFTHIGIDQDGAVGKVKRPYQTKTTGACGAILQHQVSDRQEAIDMADPEQSILSLRLQKAGDEGDLINLTETALKVSLETLKAAINAVLDPTVYDYAILSGIHINCDDGFTDYIWPFEISTMLDGQKGS